jgi:bifunctional non-homologous end joining protein LigD
MNPADKRLAVMVEDHPLEYVDFEGVIPDGSYGAGPVVVWDCGTYKADETTALEVGLRSGKLTFALNGKKLSGSFTLVQLGGAETGKEWLLIKGRDNRANPDWKLQSDLTPERVQGLVVRSPPCETS